MAASGPLVPRIGSPANPLTAPLAGPSPFVVWPMFLLFGSRFKINVDCRMAGVLGLRKAILVDKEEVRIPYRALQQLGISSMATAHGSGVPAA